MVSTWADMMSHVSIFFILYAVVHLAKVVVIWCMLRLTSSSLEKAVKNKTTCSGYCRSDFLLSVRGASIFTVCIQLC
jgi:hypothetical protein